MSSSRSTSVEVTNDTRNTLLIKVSQGLDHGEWGAEPPDRMTPGGHIYQWESHSDGVLTGTEGWVRYYPVAVSDNIVIPSPVPDEETIYIHWDNPFVGSNSYNTTAPNPYQIVQEGGTGTGDTAATAFHFGGVNGPNTCLPGFVWRNAFPGDAVCVTPQSRDQAAADNSRAASRVDPNGAYGPNSCVVPYVWRNARPGDAVCVTSEVRDQVAAENNQAQNTVV